MKTISNKVYAALAIQIEELERQEKEDKEVTLMWLIHGTSVQYPNLREAKNAAQAAFTQDVIFLNMGRYTVVEYYFKPVVLIVLGRDCD